MPNQPKENWEEEKDNYSSPYDSWEFGAISALLTIALTIALYFLL